MKDFLRHLSISELNIISCELNQVMDQYAYWIANVHKVLVCKTKIPKALQKDIKNAPNTCFRQWYNLVDNKRLKKDETFIKIGVLHNKLIDTILDIIAIYVLEKELPVKFYNIFIKRHTELFALLHEVINDIDELRNQIDPLTNLFNRSSLQYMIDAQYKKSLRTKEDFCIVMADIDYFKKVNDSYGHDVGDKVLKEFASLCKLSLRKYDLIARWGGEEFLILLPDTNIKKGYKVINRLRKVIESYKIKTRGKKINITCSFGVAGFNDQLTIENLTKDADKALYRSKNNGRNRVTAGV